MDGAYRVTLTVQAVKLYQVDASGGPETGEVGGMKPDMVETSNANAAVRFARLLQPLEPRTRLSIGGGIGSLDYHTRVGAGSRIMMQSEDVFLPSNIVTRRETRMSTPSAVEKPSDVGQWSSWSGKLSGSGVVGPSEVDG